MFLLVQAWGCELIVIVFVCLQVKKWMMGMWDQQLESLAMMKWWMIGKETKGTPKKPKELGDWVPPSQLLLKLTSLVISMMGIECIFQNKQA